jgi:hypothetical protein
MFAYYNKMKIYGLFKVINKNNKKIDSFNLFNLLHPDKKLNLVNEIDIDPKTFFTYFFEDVPSILKASINIQYIEYDKFKRELEHMINRKNISIYEHDIITKMVTRLITAENKFIKYKEDVSKMEQMEMKNQNILDEVISSQPKYAKDINKYLNLYHDYIELELTFDEFPDDLKLLFDMKEIKPIDYTDSIMYNDSIISFYRTGIVHENSKIIIDDRIQYVVFEIDDNETVKLKINESENIKKLKDIMKLYEELNMPVPFDVKLQLDNLTGQIFYKYKDKNLLIYKVGNGDKDLEYEIINKL